MSPIVFPLQKIHAGPPLVRTARTLLLPYIPIGIINKATGQRFDTLALIDSGCWANLFPVSIAQVIGINPVENELSEPFVGIAQQQAVAYPHEVLLEIGGWGFETTIHFSPAVGQETTLLGMRGFFNLFVVKIDTKKERIELTAINKK